jgi:hypothetical protein
MPGCSDTIEVVRDLIHGKSESGWVIIFFLCQFVTRRANVLPHPVPLGAREGRQMDVMWTRRGEVSLIGAIMR